MTKNPHAVILGRKGGKARAAALAASERIRIAKMGGRPTLYRWTLSGHLERFDGVLWLTLAPPYDKAAKAYLRRHRSNWCSS